MTTPSIRFNSEDHTYWIKDGDLPERRVKSHTGMIRSVGLTEDAAFPAMVRGMDRGAKVHEALQFFDEGDLDEESLDPEIVPRLEGWKAFRKEYNFIPAEIEKVEYSRPFDFVARLDRCGAMNGSFSIVEIKNGLPAKWHSIQLALQDIARGGNHFPRYAVYLDGEGRFKVKRYDEYADYDIALAVAAVCNWRSQNRGK